MASDGTSGDLAELRAFVVASGCESASVDPFMLAAFPKAVGAEVRRASEASRPRRISPAID
jgi:hypothetical protein